VKCVLCFTTLAPESALTEHLQLKHNVSPGQCKLLGATLLTRSSEPHPSMDEKCPMCLQGGWATQRKFVRHVGRHMEEIALSVLPREVDSDSDEQVDDDTTSEDSYVSAQQAEKGRLEDIGAGDILWGEKAKKSLASAFRQMDLWAEKAALQKDIRETAKSFFKQVYNATGLRGEEQDVVAAGCIMIACQQDQAGHSINEICYLTQISKKNIQRVMLVIDEWLRKIASTETGKSKTDGDVVNKFIPSSPLSMQASPKNFPLASPFEEPFLSPQSSHSNTLQQNRSYFSTPGINTTTHYSIFGTLPPPYPGHHAMDSLTPGLRRANPWDAPLRPDWGITKAGKPRTRLAQACLNCRYKKICCEPIPNSTKCAKCEQDNSPCSFESGCVITPTVPSDLIEDILPEQATKRTMPTRNSEGRFICSYDDCHLKDGYNFARLSEWR
jgi:Transcription factor TFIIB repeat